MFKDITRFFKDRIAPAAKDSGDRGHPLEVATCALLLEVAHVDNEFSAGERKTIAGLLRQRFQLTPEEAGSLIEMADRERTQSTDMYQFARLINKEFSRSRKLAVLELLWQVVYSDGVLEAHEDALMHRMSNLLGLRHEELIALKLKIKKQQ